METLSHTFSAEEITLISESYFISPTCVFGEMYTGQHIIPSCGQRCVLIGSVTFAWRLLGFLFLFFFSPCK